MGASQFRGIKPDSGSVDWRYTGFMGRPDPRLLLACPVCHRDFRDIRDRFLLWPRRRFRLGLGACGFACARTSSRPAARDWAGLGLTGLVEEPLEMPFFS